MSSIVKKLRHTLMFVGLGAVIAYFLDPKGGSRRRELIRKKFDALAGSGQDPEDLVMPFSRGTADESAAPKEPKLAPVGPTNSSAAIKPRDPAFVGDGAQLRSDAEKLIGESKRGPINSGSTPT